MSNGAILNSTLGGRISKKALAVRGSEELARRLAIHRELTGEATNTLAIRLLEDYLADARGKAVAAAAFEAVDDQYRLALRRLA